MHTVDRRSVWRLRGDVSGAKKRRSNSSPCPRAAGRLQLTATLGACRHKLLAEPKSNRLSTVATAAALPLPLPDACVLTPPRPATLLLPAAPATWPGSARAWPPSAAGWWRRCRSSTETTRRSRRRRCLPGSSRRGCWWACAAPLLCCLYGETLAIKAMRSAHA